MLTLFSQQDSGNCYKVRLLLAHLGHPFRIVDVDANSGVTRQAPFLGLNPIGKVPLLAFDDGRYLAESGAILLHLAEGTALLPGDPFDRAKAYEWMFFEQYSHEPAVAVRRSLLTYPERAGEATPERLRELLEDGRHALAVMERRLREADWLAGDRFSVADIALYAYTHMAGEGGFVLSDYPGVTRWVERVAGLPGHVGIGWRPD
ncbi:glutathione S-transferase family protein [Propylenella binzhouense]|uniref:Glutathione S-transferase family protein n=1 Tax=Propylenella binzhouense TaxID=2555902 RepID=A0A964WV47_9HYPH|nr:glutathione S-transferase family protein [Propylenella binzhouense]MYZ49837.1 glutathione S-transferase family protein [Propylenella binzhouense]